MIDTIAKNIQLCQNVQNVWPGFNSKIVKSDWFTRLVASRTNHSDGILTVPARYGSRVNFDTRIAKKKK